MLLIMNVAGFPKASIEASIARGQGISSTGATLESVTLEAIVPPSVACVIDCQTDSKLRLLQDLRLIIKNHGGTVTPTSYLFEKKGIIVFEKDERKMGVNEILDEAIEAGAEDVDTNSDGNVVVWTEPGKTTSTANTIAEKLKMRVQSSDIIWDPNDDTKVQLESTESVKELVELIDELQEVSGIQGIYINAVRGSVDSDTWADLQSRISA